MSSSINSPEADCTPKITAKKLRNLNMFTVFSNMTAKGAAALICPTIVTSQYLLVHDIE